MCMPLCDFCLYTFAFAICPRVLSVRFFVLFCFVLNRFQYLISLVDLFFGFVALFFLSFYYFLLFYF